MVCGARVELKEGRMGRRSTLLVVAMEDWILEARLGGLQAPGGGFYRRKVLYTFIFYGKDYIV